MADRKEDIGVRIVTHYADALADVQRFTGLAEKALEALPKVVQNVVKSVDTLIGSIGRLGQANGVDQLVHRLTQSNQEATNLAGSIDRLNDGIGRLDRNDGTGRIGRNLADSNRHATNLSRTFDQLLATGKGIGAAMAGWQAGKMVLAPVVGATMDYGMRLTHATNVTAPGASIDQKLRLMAEIDARLNAARHAAGGSRDDLLTGFESLMARNSIGDKDQTLGVMPGIAKTATAGNASFEDMAKVTSGLVKSLGVAPKDNEKALAQLFFAGQDGGFELKNMAHYLPAQAAAAKNGGLSGMSAVAKLAALNELAIDASGTPDQAGVNVTDFLNSMNSAHLANNLKRFSFDKKNKTLVFNDGKRKADNYLDLSHQLAENAGHGVDAIDTMIQLTGMAVKGDPKYAAALQKRDAARARLAAAQKNGDSAGQIAAQQDLSATMDSVVQILEGRGMGKLFHNQQELRGAIGVLTNPQAYHDKVALYGARGTIANRDNALDFIQAQPGYKAQMFEQDKADALYRGMDGFNSWLGKLADGASTLYQQHPLLAAAMEDGKVAVKTMGAAAGGAALALTLLTKSAITAAGAPGVPGAPGGPGGGGGGGAPGIAGWGGRFGSMLKWTGITSALFGGLEAYGIYSNDHLTAQQKKIGYAGAAGGTAFGALGGAATGAAVGSVFPGVGTVIGAIIGSALGSWGGHAAGTAAGEAMFGDPKAGQIKRDMMGAQKPQPVDVRLQVSFDQNGNAYVKQKSFRGSGIRLDTGPMMTY